MRALLGLSTYRADGSPSSPERAVPWRVEIDAENLGYVARNGAIACRAKGPGVPSR